MATTPEAAEAPEGRPPDKPPTPQCLFPPEPKQSQAAAPIDSTVTDNESAPELLATICSVLIPTYTETEVQHRLCPPVSQEVHALWCARNAGWLTQNEFEEAILKFFVTCDAPAALLFADDSATTAALTPRTPSPAGCTPGDLGAQDATASDQGPEFLCVPSPISPDVTGTKVPKTSTTALPLYQEQESAVVSPCFPRSHEMQLGDRDSSVPTGLVSSGLSSEGPPQTAEHDTGSLMSQASRLNDPPSDKWETEGGPLAGAGHVVVVKAKGAVIDSVDPGTFLCPDSATRNPKIIFEVPPPGPNIGAGDDNAAAKLPPPLTLPGSWTLVAPAGSEELGAPLSTGPGVDALLPTPTADPDNDTVQSPPPLTFPRPWTLGASALSEDLGALLSTGMGARPVGRGKDDDEDEGQAPWVDDDAEGDEDGAREGAEEVTDKDAEVGNAAWADDDDAAKGAAEEDTAPGAAEEDAAPVCEEVVRDSDADEGEDVATEDADDAADADAAADLAPGTDDCFRGD